MNDNYIYGELNNPIQEQEKQIKENKNASNVENVIIIGAEIYK